jgi:hypothetical protein
VVKRSHRPVDVLQLSRRAKRTECKAGAITFGDCEARHLPCEIQAASELGQRSKDCVQDNQRINARSRPLTRHRPYQQTFKETNAAYFGRWNGLETCTIHTGRMIRARSNPNTGNPARRATRCLVTGRWSKFHFSY